jgi:hypothetical protein
VRARTTGRRESLTDSLQRSLEQALDRARHDARPLYGELARLSGLPGPRANTAALDAFAEVCAARGEEADALAIAMAKLDAEHAPGATALEFLPMCGVAALGARAALDPRARPQLLAVLHECADDLRFRVREVVPSAVARVGASAGDALVAELADWTNGFFHAAAVLRAMASPGFVTKLTHATAAIARMDEAFTLAESAPRALHRYPGHKALVDALSSAPSALAARFGPPVFDMLVRWTATKEPWLREAIEKNLQGARMAGRWAAEVDRVRAGLTASKAPPRNPDHYVGPTRARGRKRHGRR